MTRIEHVNLVLNDIDPTLAFLQAAFPHWKVRAKGSSPWYGKPRNWLHFGDDYTFITLNDNGEGPARDLQGHSQGLAHIGFSITGLDQLIARLKTHGYEPRTDIGEETFRRNIYFIDPAGIEFEFVEYSSDNPAERNI
jgi:catechol 2,3-dioxygenase-like lactoylglutathione lyase family enzyme